MVRMYVSIIWYSNHKYTNNTKVFNIIQLFKCKKYEYTKLNLPRSRSRVSVSKEYPTENGKNWWQNPLSDVTEQVKEQFCLLPKLIESASKS